MEQLTLNFADRRVTSRRKIGQHFRHVGGGYKTRFYILAHVDAGRKVSLVNIETGGRYTQPITVGSNSLVNHLTNNEWRKVSGSSNSFIPITIDFNRFNRV